MAVKFAARRKVRVFPKYSREEKESVWWTPENFKTFRKECWKVLKVVREEEGSISNGGSISPTTRKSISGNDADEDYCCTRGLEDWSRTKYSERRKRMKDSIVGVLQEQDCLKNEGRIDDVQISMLYSKLAEEAGKIAQLRGSIDAQIHLLEVEKENQISERQDQLKSKTRLLSQADRKRRNPFTVGLDPVKQECKPNRSRAILV